MKYGLNLKTSSIKLFLYALVLLICVEDLFGQSEFNNHQKYWFLRTKLRNDLMKVGLGQGESIPFAQRGLYTSIDWSDNNVSYSSKLSGGDLVSELGIYIGVLATEYKLLKNSNQNTDSVRYELYCALNAVNRLDYNAEPLYGSYSNNLDGFLIRDDIPKDFVLKNYKHFNYYNSWDGITTNIGGTYGKQLDVFNYPNTVNTDRGFLSSIQKGQWETGSVYYDDFQYKNEHPSQVLQYGNYAVSQDHLISLMYGLRLVSEYVDQSANWNNQPFLWTEGAYTSILDEATRISDRIIRNLRDNHWRLKKPNGYDVSDNDGGNVHAYAYPLAQIAGKINQPNKSVNNWPTNRLVPEVDPAYHDLHTEGFGFQEWESISKVPGTSFDVTVQIAELTASCQCLFEKVGGNFITIITQVLTKIWKWLGFVFGWVTQVSTSLFTYFLPISWNNYTSGQMIPNATYLAPNAIKHKERIKYQQDYALLTNLLLAHKTADYAGTGVYWYTYRDVLSRTSDILNNAPCAGPHNFTNHQGNGSFSGGITAKPSYDVYEWSGYSLIEHPNSMGADNVDFSATGNPPYSFDLNTGEYNGLDYMLYHNLYYLYKQLNENVTVSTVNLRERLVDYPLPLSNGYCSQQSPGTIGSFEWIIANGTVNSNADVTFRAGKQFGVTYGTNYDILPGANVTINIDPYNCSNDYRGQAQRQANPNSSPSSNPGEMTDMYGAMGASQATHYVAYSKEEAKAETKDQRENKPSKTMTNKTVINLNDQLTIYPNPSEGKFQIKLNVQNDNEKYSLQIYDATGNAVKIYENISAVEKIISIDNDGMAAGAYLVRIIANQSGKQFSEKIIIK